MKSRMLRVSLLCMTCAFPLLLSACEKEASSSVELSVPSGVSSPCDLSEGQMGQSVTVAGEIVFIDSTDPDGSYADLEAEGCRVGIWVDKREWDSWNAETQAQFAEGTRVFVDGILDSVPMPARPDEYQLVIALEEAPRLIGSSPDMAGGDADSGLEPLVGPACGLSITGDSQNTQIEGVIVHVEEDTAAGLASQLEVEGCIVRLWVEHTRWDLWSAAEQELYALGQKVMVEGIMTVVLHESVLDLSFPPTGLTETDS